MPKRSQHRGERLGSPRGDPVPIQAALPPQKGIPGASGMSDRQRATHRPVQDPLCRPTDPATSWPLLRQPLPPWRPLSIWKKMLLTVFRAGLRNPLNVGCVATGKLLNLSGPQFPPVHLTRQQRREKHLPQEVLIRNKELTSSHLPGICRGQHVSF